MLREEAVGIWYGRSLSGRDDLIIEPSSEWIRSVLRRIGDDHSESGGTNVVPAFSDGCRGVDRLVGAAIPFHLFHGLRRPVFMATRAHTIPTRVLFRSPLLSIYDYQCRRRDCGLTDEYEAKYSSVVFPCRGVFVKQVEGEEVIADVNHAVFFVPGETFRFRHPCGCGDRVTEIAPNERVLRDIRRSIDPGLTDDPRPFRLIRHAPTDSTGWMLHRLLKESLCRNEPPDALEVEEIALHLVGRTIRAGIVQRGVSRGNGHRRAARRMTQRAHDELVERTRLLLAGRFDEPHTIESIASAVASSPYHLCRVFRRCTGTTIHRFLNQLRLRAAFDGLLDRGPELTRLALDVGFSSHSHLTCAFRREFGVTPSSLRDWRRSKRGAGVFASKCSCK